MRLITSCAMARRTCAGMLAISLCLGPIIDGARAQELPTGGSSTITSSGEPVLLREQPGYDAAALATLGDGNPLDIAGEPVTAADGTTWLPVVAGGQSGYVPTGYVRTNADMGPKELRQHAALDDPAETLLGSAVRQMGLSARAYHRVLKLARTIADLAAEESITTAHVAEALQYRPRVAEG